jgi:hypothetical protein
MGLQRGLGGRWRLVSPQPVDEAVHRHVPVRLRGEQSQQASRQGAGHAHWCAAVADLEDAEHRHRESSHGYLPLQRPQPAPRS